MQADLQNGAGKLHLQNAAMPGWPIFFLRYEFHELRAMRSAYCRPTYSHYIQQPFLA